MVRTREQDREYQRERRKLKAAESHVRAAPVNARESARMLVLRELDGLPGARSMHASVAAALAMADVLDDPAAVPQHPAAAGQLRQIMVEIRAARSVAGASALTMIRGGRSAG